MNFLDICDLCTNKCDLGIMEKDLEFLYGMSKMTVPNEIENGESYEFILFPEFLEFIGRTADFKFEGSELESLSLSEKIEHLLDELFVPYEFTRKLVQIEVEEESMSDSDY